MSKGWIGVDLDGTLAMYSEWVSPTHIGEPVPAMADRVRRWLQEGREVRIFTARVSDLVVRDQVIDAIQAWCWHHLGWSRATVTNVKDYAMIELWDDRAVQVEPNTGRPIGQSTRGLT